jgi:glycerol-3-phosphate acyltransferase PlsY
MTGPGPLISICFQAGEIPPSIPLHLLGIVTVQSTSSAAEGQLLWPLLASFVCGSIPFAWLIGKSRGIDLLKVGSGNPGATNLSREVGKPYGLLGLSLDVLKGAIPILWFSSFPPGTLLLIGAASVVGHCFSPFLRGRGGKGVATTGGVLLALEPVIALVMLSSWFVTFKVIKSVGMASVMASLTGALLALCLLLGWEPLVSVLRTADEGLKFPSMLGAVLLTLSMLVLIRHRSNIKEYCDSRREEESR